MGLAAGALSQVSVSPRQAVLSSSVATGGTTPYSYQWYRSVSTGFVPGSSNILSGKTSVDLTDTGLVPSTVYYYKVVVIDSAGTPASATANQLAVTTSQLQQNQNQFVQEAVLGMTDLRLNYNTLPVVFDPQGSGTLYAGSAVKWSTNAFGTPMVVPSTAQADIVAGFVNYNIKDQSYVAGESLEISMKGNVIYLMACAAINRGDKLVSLPAAVAGGVVGGVTPTTGSSGYPIIGFSLDTVSAGYLVRVELDCPSGRVDS